MAFWSRWFARRPDSMTRLRERKERLSLRYECAKLKAANKVMESAFVPDWVGAYVDLMDRYRDGNQLLSPISTPNDRRYGRDFPIFQTEQELALYRAPARVLCQTNSHGIGFLGGLTSYVIGDGYTYRAAPKMDDAGELVDKSQDIIDEFIARVLWNELEQELFHRTREDGEYLLRHGLEDDGLTWVRTIEPEQLFQPPNSDQAEWSFGICTDREDVWNRYAYWVAYLSDPADGEEVPAHEIVHAKVNTKRSIKRGMTDFCFDVYEKLQTASKLGTAMGQGGAVQASIAMVLQHEATSIQQVQSFQAQRVDGTTQDPVTGRQTDYQKMQPGMEVQIPKGMTYVPPPAYSNANNFVQILAACLRSAGVRWNAPEWLGSADASNNNYASSLTAESPFVKTCERWQGFYKRRFLATIRIVLEHAVEAGRLPAEALNRVEVQCEPPLVQSRNRLEQAQENQVYLVNRVKSPQTIQQELGLDPDQERANWEEFDAEQGAGGMPLQLPPDTVIGKPKAAPSDETPPSPAG